MSDQPKCPFCGSRKIVGGSIMFCTKCKAQFDDMPDEGGTHSNFNPAARLEREERERARKLKRVGDGRRR